MEFVVSKTSQPHYVHFWETDEKEYVSVCEEHIDFKIIDGYYFSRIVLNSMEELTNFIIKYGKCVIWIEEGINHIEIYDSYRE